MTLDGARPDGATADGGVAGNPWDVAAGVVDPELPMLTLADLGVLRDVHTCADGTVVVTLTPTYSGCPALAEMRTDLRTALHAAGHPDAEVRTRLSPPWSTDDITPAGRRALAAHGVAPPQPGRRPGSGPVPLTLEAPTPTVPCPRCGSADTAQTSEFGPTPCTALRRCRDCAEPFEHVTPR